MESAHHSGLYNSASKNLGRGSHVEVLLGGVSEFQAPGLCNRLLFQEQLWAVARTAVVATNSPQQLVAFVSPREAFQGSDLSKVSLIDGHFNLECFIQVLPANSGRERKYSYIPL